jgi:hypothetical protein
LGFIEIDADGVQAIYALIFATAFLSELREYLFTDGATPSNVSH